MFVYSAVHIYLNISLADFWHFALLAGSNYICWFLQQSRSQRFPHRVHVWWATVGHVGRRENPGNKIRPIFALGMFES